MGKKIGQVKEANSDKKIFRYLIVFPLLAWLVKMIIMFNIQAGGWLGADGENYIAGVDALMINGFFAEEPKLSYWPAGYPLMLWPIGEISPSKFLYIVSFIQSTFYAYATYFLTRQLLKSTIKYLAFTVSLLISFNPTLSLSSLAIGYEAPIAACFMMIIALVIKNYGAEINRKYWISVIGIAAWFAISIFMQPRFLLIGFLFVLIWTLKTSSRKVAAAVLISSSIVMSITPAIMIYRNINVIDQAKISTNLGVTMAIGAGDETTGGYARKGPVVPCEPIPPATSVNDDQQVKCVIDWYLANPSKAVRLAFNKAQFFWSPWSGPKAEGTMARNPWLKISPAKSITKNIDGARLVTGPVGVTISYLWILGQIFFLFWGYQAIRKFGDQAKLVANLLLLPIVLSWLISIGTIGDHRFRIPTMSLSLILQGAGLLALRKKYVKAL